MTRTRTSVLGATFFLLAGALALTLVLLTGKSSGGNQLKFGAGLAGPSSKEATAGEGPAAGYEAYRSATRTYPATAIPPAVVKRAKATFTRIARADARRIRSGRVFLADGKKWRQYGPRVNATQPGVTAFSGATNDTAARTVALVADPACSATKCRLWAGVSGGGVWRTDNALAPDPEWKQLSPDDLDQNSVGTLVLDPTDKKHDTLYLGTGEGNRCSSGCEAGAGVYKSTDSGNHWKKLDGSCVSNPTYTCVNPGKDSFLGRGINGIVIDPRNGNHIFVGSAQAVRGLSHVIGSGGTTRAEPGANQPGLYESFDGGKTFTEVWNGSIPGGFGVTDVGLDPLNPDVVYASAFDAGAWRRDAGAAATAFSQVFAPQFAAGVGQDRTMFALTVKNAKTRIYLTDGTANGGGILGALAANFWRTDNANQLSAAALLASQGPGAGEPNPANVFPATYSGWQKLTSKTTTSPFFATDDFCTGQCWYDQDVYTPAGMPDTVYVIGSFLYGELPCNTKGVSCGNGRSNGRASLYSNTAGDPDGSRADLRTFSDLTDDARETPAPWCAFAPYGFGACTHAQNGMHPDQHEVIVNPGNPTQIFQASDGGIVRTSGSFADISSQCDESWRSGVTGGPPAGGSYLTCKRLLSRVPTALDHISKKVGSTLQFINVAINPSHSCEVMGGTQDNGTWSNNSPNCDRNTFNQVIYGDGANAVYDATNATWRANGFTSGFGDSNFRNGDPERWVITTGPMIASGEAFSFYWPQIGDPNPVPGTHPIYNGGRHVWRSWAFGAGHTSVPQQTTPDIAFYETNCPEFVTGGDTPTCGDYQPLGGPAGNDTPGDLAGTFYGTDRVGPVLNTTSWIARSGGDHGTMWAATSGGRIFVSHNADAVDPAAVTWHRIDSSTSGNSPTRFPSSIYVDPADPGHAWIAYSGYSITTPTTPGHVFSVQENGTAPGSGIFTNLNVESGSSAYPTPFSDGDLPVSDIVRDDATHTLYVGTDFGVLRGSNDGASWHVTTGMPRYEIMHLEIQPSNRAPTCVGTPSCPRLLYAATHSQGFWRMRLGGH